MSSTTRSQHDVAPGAVAGIDPRGPQFVAAVTAVVLVAVLLLAPGPAGVALLAVQAAAFALAAGRGVQRTPYSWLFRTLVRTRLSAPAELEDPAPPRFAQAVGLAFALVAALLNAVFRLCLGCELYLLLKRVTSGGRAAKAR